MRVRTVLQTLSVLLLLISASVVQPKLAAAEAPASNLSAAVHSNDPTKPSLRLQNTSKQACQIISTAQGTVAITKVMQHGKVIQPLPIDSASDEDVGYLLQDQFKTLQPGQAADITLPVYKVGADYILRATTWSADAGSFSAEYPITKTGALLLDLSYTMPVTPKTGAPICGDASVHTQAASIWQRWWRAVIVIIIVLVLLVLAVWWWRKHPRHRGKIACIGAFLLLSAGALWYHAPLAHADVVVPPELQSTYDGCIATFNANRDITGPILDMLNNPANHFEIVHTTGVGSDMTGRRNPSSPGGGIFRIYWNPDDHHRYAGTGGYPDACSVLYHELFHALDQLKGSFSRADCAGSGIETKEVEATRAQNVLRLRLGLPARSHYGDRPLPTGDCRAGAHPTACTGAHCGGTTGDPHMSTFDGQRYDFQAAGEFIIARTQSDAFEIQARQEPWLDSELVTINTGLAFKLGNDRVEVQAGKTPTLLINGKPHMLAGSKLPDGGQIDLAQSVISLTWKDGSIAYVEPVGTYGLTLSVQLSDDLSGKVEGLLGDANEDSKNDLHARNSKEIITPTYQNLYPKFADSWRINDKGSLFTYDRGKSTSSYTIRNFPHKPTDAKILPGYAAAELFCKNYGITDPAILADCTLDMAITGRPEFARSASHNQTFTTGTNFSGTTWQLTIKNPGDSASVTFAGKVGEKIFVHVPQSTLPSQCGSLQLVDPDGQVVTSGCIINGQGEIDGTVLPATGQYTVRLQPDGPTGTATVRLLRINDKQAAIIPDGDTVTARIDQPGVVGRYTFTGQAGQHVYVHVPSSTLVSECGVLRLLDPEGHEIMSGCIINHVGDIDTAILPASGQYTVVVDPGGTTIGQAQLQLILPTADTTAITMDGSTQTANLKKPGSIASFTFSAPAGQRIFVDIPSSTLSSECGLLTLHAPDGSVISSGCIINHVGNLNEDGVVLPASGQYTLTLDPGGASTGTSAIKLRSH